MAALKLLVTAACLANKALFVNGISSVAATDWQNFHIFMLPLFPAQHHTANWDAPTWTVWHQHELLVISSSHLVLSILHLLGHQRSVAGLVLLSAFGGHQKAVLITAARPGMLARSKTSYKFCPTIWCAVWCTDGIGEISLACTKYLSIASPCLRAIQQIGICYCFVDL